MEEWEEEVSKKVVMKRNCVAEDGGGTGWDSARGGRCGVGWVPGGSRMGVHCSTLLVRWDLSKRFDPRGLCSVGITSRSSL